MDPLDRKRLTCGDINSDWNTCGGTERNCTYLNGLGFCSHQPNNGISGHLLVVLGDQFLVHPKTDPKIVTIYLNENIWNT